MSMVQLKADFYRLSTGKESTPLNIKWIEKNHRDVLLKLVNKEKPKLSQMFAEYAIKSIESNAYSVKESTQYGYETMLNRNIIPYFKHYHIDEIMPSDIRAWQNQTTRYHESNECQKCTDTSW